uniref:Uncharacterized protein n=1 Tax=Salix viminalis TaxID=40686 RepID=A0A6N2KZE0_SALVM
MWGDEQRSERKHEMLKDYVNIDSHILCTSEIADSDSDGVAEMSVTSSYYFDHEYYDNPEHLKVLGDEDVGKCLASSSVVFNLDTKQVKRNQELELSARGAADRDRGFEGKLEAMVDIKHRDILTPLGY